MDNRGSSLIISAIMLTAAMVIIVFTGYQWGSDVIESGKESTSSMLAQKDLESIDNAINAVTHEGKWSTRVVSVSSEFGFENNKTVMVYNTTETGTRKIKLDSPKITSCDQFILCKPKISVDDGEMTVISYSIKFTLPHKHVNIKNAGTEHELLDGPGNVTIDGYTYHNISRVNLYKINMLVS